MKEETLTAVDFRKTVNRDHILGATGKRKLYVIGNYRVDIYTSTDFDFFWHFCRILAIFRQSIVFGNMSFRQRVVSANGGRQRVVSANGGSRRSVTDPFSHRKITIFLKIKLSILSLL